MSSRKIAAVVWARHEARTEAFAERLEAKLYNISVLKDKRPYLVPIRYPIQWFQTWHVLFRDKPDLVFVTNSPPIAGLCVMVYKWLTKLPFVLDNHGPSLYNAKWGWTLPLQRFTSRFADLNTICSHQEKFKTLFESWGSKAMLIANPPKQLSAELLQQSAQTTEKHFTYVGTFGSDEPVEIILEAAKQFPDYTFSILGNTSLANPEWLKDPPANVKFTGYLRKDEYWGQLARARAVIVLTTHDNSLSGAAQDALFINKPIIISDQSALREYFTGGTLFIDHTPESLQTAIETLLADEGRYKQEIRELNERVKTKWAEAFELLQTKINTIIRKN